MYQTDFSARELFFEFDAGSSFSSFHPKRAQYLGRREFELNGLAAGRIKRIKFSRRIYAAAFLAASNFKF